MTLQLPEAKRFSLVILSQKALSQDFFKACCKKLSSAFNNVKSGGYVSIDLERVLNIKPLNHPTLSNNFLKTADLQAYSFDFKQASQAQAVYDQLSQMSEMKNIIILEPIAVFESD